MYWKQKITENLSLCVSYIFQKFDGSWKIKVWCSLWYHPIILSPFSFKTNPNYLLMFAHTCKKSSDLVELEGPTTSTTSLGLRATPYKGATKGRVNL
jgi:hypothetical protein